MEKEISISLVRQGASPEWWNAASLALMEVAKTKLSFTTDDVWEALNAKNPPECREPRVMGALMVQASKSELAFPTPSFRMSGRGVCHNRPLRVWQSNVMEGGNVLHR